MKRTTIVLTDELAALLERERRRRGVSAAAVVRDALDAYFGGRPKTLAIAALGRSGQRHIARDAEAILAREWTLERLMGRDEAGSAPPPGADGGPDAEIGRLGRRQPPPQRSNREDADLQGAADGTTEHLPTLPVVAPEPAT
jgi:hypothetical protein